MRILKPKHLREIIMSSFILIFSILMMPRVTAQECPSVDPSICWPYTNTGDNHTILFHSSATMTVNGVAIPNNTYIGVFYDSLGTLNCAGYTQWSGISTFLSAWGADDGNDGLADGETFTFNFLMPDGVVVDDVVATYASVGGLVSHTDQYIDNGISQVLTLVGEKCYDYDTTINLVTCNSGSVGTVIDSFNTFWSDCDSVITTITTLETEAPNAVCQDVTVQLDGNGDATVSTAMVDNGSTDNCSIQSL